jgi:hypothetical protein
MDAAIIWHQSFPKHNKTDDQMYVCKVESYGKTVRDTTVRRPRTPEERLALWRSVQAILKRRQAGEIIAELEKIRNEWDRELPAFKRLG